MNHRLSRKTISSRALASTLLLGFSLFPALAAESKQEVARTLEIAIKPGSAWSHEKRFGLIKVKLVPQIAIWIEREDGAHLGDLFVTEKAGKSKWGAVRRPDALPVWSHGRGVVYADGLYMPTRDKPLPDAVSGATPAPEKSGGVSRIRAALPAGIPDGRYRIKVEVNNSFDYNPSYAEKLPAGHPFSNGVNGQPSVVYAATLELVGGVPRATVRAEPIGSGHPAGSDGSVGPLSPNLTSALEIVESIELSAVR